jgi:uncharacterized protein (DUF885 family)
MLLRRDQMRRVVHILPMLIALSNAAPAQADPGSDLAALLTDHWRWVLTSSPLTASSVGVKEADSQLDDFSLAAADQHAAQAQTFLARSDAIAPSGLNAQQRANLGILQRILTEQIEGNRLPQRVMLFTSFYSPWQRMADLPESTGFSNVADYRNYLTRLALIPQANETWLSITRQAVAGRYVQPCVTLGGLEKSIRGLASPDPERSRFYGPFARTRPANIAQENWSSLQTEAKAIIREKLNPAFTKAADYMARDYLPRCATTVSISAQPGGSAYYAYQVRASTTTNLTPEQIHGIGLDEVKRIGAEMDAVARGAGYASRAAFVAKLRTDPSYYTNSPEELLAAAALMAKQLDGKMPGFFKRLPRLPYGIKAIPAETAEGTTTAYYSPGSPENGIAGNYYVNTSKLDQRPLWELPALTAHEAVPGHHHQIALQQELDLPPLRKHLASFTAFVEGWALYAERIGMEMGIYDTPEKQFGRLSYEMWRACRLVVDTGIHAKGWSKQQAVDFMTTNTALSAANIDAEVNRYISWPGQALAYKLGELKIRELRSRAESALGESFDIAAFHDAILGQGAVPLDILDAQIDDWIASQKSR